MQKMPGAIEKNTRRKDNTRWDNIDIVNRFFYHVYVLSTEGGVQEDVTWRIRSS